jgi:hypothetical protein
MVEEKAKVGHRIHVTGLGEFPETNHSDIKISL